MRLRSLVEAEWGGAECGAECGAERSVERSVERRHGPAVSGQILGNPHDFADIALWVPIGNATSTGNVPDLASPLRLVVLQGTG